MTTNAEPKTADTAATPPANGAEASDQAAELLAKLQDPEVVEHLAAMRNRLNETFGKIVLAAMASPRYRHVPISDLHALLLNPLIRERVAIVTAKEEKPTLQGAQSGIAVWASVSDTVDAKIREQIKAGTFPVRLGPDDWRSGEINWLLDVIAPTRALSTAVIANFRQVVKGGSVRVHPYVTRAVDPDILKKLGGTPLTDDM